MSTLTDKAVRCPTCGAKSPAGSQRCRLCTRTLPRKVMATQAAFEEELYAAPIRTTRHQVRISFPVVVLLIAVLAAIGNYLWWGYGPSWASRDAAHSPGDNWRTYRGFEGATVLLPGTPISSSGDSAVGMVRRAEVAVDRNWDAVIDAQVTAPGAIADARTRRVATITVAETSAPADPVAAGADLLVAAQPATKVSEVEVRPRPQAEGHYDVTARYRRSDDPSVAGEVRARIIIQGPRAYVLATYLTRGEVRGLQDHLVGGFRLVEP